MACTYWLQLIRPSFGWYVIPAGHLPQKNLSGNPKVGFPFSPPSDHTLSYLRLMTHHSCIGWVQVGSAWALRVPHFHVRQKLVRYSCVCHGLEVHLCILPLILNLLWRELFSNFPFFIGLLLSRAGPCLIMGFPLFSPFFTPSVILLPFLPYHPTIPTVVLFGMCLLASFGPAACSSLNDSICSLDLYSYYFGLSWPITLLVGSFSHFFLLGHPWPICFPWASLAHFLILHSPELSLTLLGFPSPITVFFILGAHVLSINPLLSYFITSGLLWLIFTFLHHIMPMGLLFLSLGSFWPICFP